MKMAHQGSLNPIGTAGAPPVSTLFNAQEVSCLVDVAIDASKEEQIKGLEQVLIEMREVSRMEHKAMMEGTPQVKKEIKTMNLQEFVRVFTGPPCTIPGCSALTQQLQARADETNTKVRP